MGSEKVTRRTKLLAKITALCLVASLAALSPLSAFGEDGTTNIFSDGLTRNYNTNIVGEFGSFNAQIITNASVVNVTNGFCAIGYSAAANSNIVVVIGPGSVWSNRSIAYSYSFRVGEAGSFNQLTITNGGKVFNNNESLVGSADGANNNSVLVSGSGSIWHNSWRLRVGLSGSGNNLVINDGGQVHSVEGYIGVNPTSSNNSVLVTGSGSLWTNDSSLCVAWLGSGNQLTISNGAHVVGPSGTVGSELGANNNSVLVSGSGSLWTNTGVLYLGYHGSSNQLIINNGATVVFDNDSYADNYRSHVGYYTGSSNNSVLVSGSGSLWKVGRYLYVGNFESSGNEVIVSNGASAVIGSDTHLGYYTTSSNNMITITGPGSVWSNGGIFTLGENGSGNQLVISNGATLISGAGNQGATIVGRFGGSNSVVVSGSGSVLTCYTRNLTVGQSSSGNQLTINDGASVVVFGDYASLGDNAGAGNNAVVVSGIGSFFNLTGRNLYVGQSGFDNSLTITNAGHVLRETLNKGSFPISNC